MEIIEIFANRRSGHHFFMSWFVSNLTGFKDNKIKDLNKITWITDTICHYNDATYHAFFNEEKVKSEIKEIIKKQPEYLIINYEESGLYNKLNGEGSVIYNNNPKKVVFIRDFLNTMASKWAVSETDLREFYFGFKKEEQIIENINYWKEIAKSFLDESTIGLTYEELLTDDNRRKEFLNYFGIQEIIKPNEIQGTKSSFSTKNFNERYKEVDFSKKFKNIVNNDTDLKDLIRRFNYNFFDKNKFLINKLDINNKGSEKSIRIEFTSHIDQDNIKIKVREKFFGQGWLLIVNNLKIKKGVRYWIQNQTSNNGLKFRLCEDLEIEYIDSNDNIIESQIINVGRDTYKNRSLGKDISIKNIWTVGDSNMLHYFSKYNYDSNELFFDNKVIVPIDLAAISINRFINRDYVSFFKGLPIMDCDDIILNLGEIDCRIGFSRNANHKKIKVTKNIDDIIDRYLKSIEEIQNSINKEVNIKLMLPNPAVRDGWVKTKESIDLYLGNFSENQRLFNRQYFEKKLINECNKKGIEVLDLLNSLKGDDGFLDENYLLKNDTHIKNTDKVLKEIQNYYR